MTIVASLLGGCSLGETKIEYEPFVKALDEGDMTKVMSASDDGYASVTQRGIYSTYEEKEDGRHVKSIYQNTEVYIIRRIKDYMEVQHKKLLLI
ncbi:DUF3952 domain-containing protein [Bacillus mycoides]|uniref:DUF3952 domain-containing protein n=1 Tax=Bacillus mycoides TaxID=1405 RepID=UPI0039C85E73